MVRYNKNLKVIGDLKSENDVLEEFKKMNDDDLKYLAKSFFELLESYINWETLERSGKGSSMFDIVDIMRSSFDFYAKFYRD